MTKDDDLIKRCSSDPEAFKELVERFRRPLFGFLRNLAGPQAAEDIFQEVFVRVLRSASGYEARGKPQSWLFRIANNLALDHIAKEKRRPSIPLEALPSEPAAGGTPLSELERGEACQRLRAALESLPLEQRQVFLMREISGMSFKEVSEALGIPLGTALSRMNYALKKLKKVLGGDDGL